MRRTAALALLLACSPQPAPPAATSSQPPLAATPQPPPVDAPQPAPSSLHGLSGPIEPAPKLPDPEEPPPQDAPEIAAPATPTPATGDPKFQIAAYRDGWIDLHRLGDDVFVSGSGGLAHEDRRGRLVAVEYGLSGQAEPALGLDAWNVRAFGGRWPDNAWLVTQYYQGRANSAPHVHRRDDSVWRQVDNKDGVLYWYYEDVLTWHSGQVLGLRAWVPDPMYGDGIDLDNISRRDRKKIETQRAAVHRGFDLLGPTPTATTMKIDPAMRRVIVAAAAPTGELFALGETGVHDRDDRLVQRWGLTGDAAVLGTTTPLAKNLDCYALAVRAADEAYVGCRRETRDSHAAHLLRFDGAAWITEPAPPGHEVRRLSVGPTGELFAVVGLHNGDTPDDELWRRPPGAAWQRITLPELRFPDVGAPSWIYDFGPERYRLVAADPEAAARTWTLEAVDVLARAPDDLWVVARTALQRPEIGLEETFRTVVLRTRATGEPLAMLHDEDLYLEALDWRPAPAWNSDKCADDIPAFTVLRTLPANAPRDQPEPALEAFVRDNPRLLANIVDIFEVHRRGRRAIGVYATLPDQAAADALLAALERAAPGERRTLECRRPRARRKFDKATGRAVDPAAP